MSEKQDALVVDRREVLVRRMGAEAPAARTEAAARLGIAGGVNLTLFPAVSISFSHARMMAADGRSKTFDASADG
ncbi:MAG TPA: beta-ketoacyl synthase N-terminal-like domain-containing protein, partial [Casimicrobiaceae bacterium]|nr:beta-ketoacyl synthase N-terminal-like domain-containing protein [Casimicrobiaceae bacterium]